MELTVEMVMELARERGDEGFTTYDVMDRYGCEYGEARRKINRQFAKLELTSLSKKRQTLFTKNKLTVYVISTAAERKRHGIKGPTGHVNVMDAISDVGHDEDYRPRQSPIGCTSLAGSIERIRTYANRVENGEEIFNENDVRGGFVRDGEIANTGFSVHGSPREYTVSVSKRGSVAMLCE
jgi:hypothetical protein